MARSGKAQHKATETACLRLYIVARIVTLQHINVTHSAFPSSVRGSDNIVSSTQFIFNSVRKNEHSLNYQELAVTLKPGHLDAENAALLSCRNAASYPAVQQRDSP